MEITCPLAGEPFYGQDTSYLINPPSYTDNGDGTVTDNNTGLMWQREDDNVSRTWNNAVAYCENLDLASYVDWRLPSKKELVGIVDYGRHNPAIDLTIFSNTNPFDYWSSIIFAAGHVAFYVRFYDGFVGVYYTDGLRQENAYARCVRSGQ